MAVSVGQTLKRRYRIDALIGKGGLGAVYRAYDMALRYRCAVKENLKSNRDSQEQFHREASILAPLRHANLPRVIDYFQTSDGCQYLVMDFIEGRDLNKILKQRAKPLTQKQALPLMIQTCKAVEYLHGQTPAIIHRDIKPHNIIIDQNKKPILVDFGIAKIYDPHHQTAKGARGFTPGFAPPEQYGTEVRTDIRSDVYSLGATLYFLLTKRKLPDALKRHLHGTSFPLPRQLNRSVSQSVEQIILKAVQTHPDQRYQRVSELHSRLAQLLPNTPGSTPHSTKQQKGRTDPSRQWLNQGIQAFRQNQYNYAIQCLEYAIDLNPDNIEAVQWLTQARLGRKKARRREKS